VNFPVFGDGRHVRAVISAAAGTGLEDRPLVYGVDYTVREVSGGGECIAAAPVPDGRVLTLYLDLPHVQPRDFDNQGRLDAEQIELGMDYVTALTAQNAAALGRAVKLPISSHQSPEELLAEIFTARAEARQSAERAEAVRDMVLSQVGGAPGVSQGIIVMWSGACDRVPEGWILCDGHNGTPDLRDRFIVGAGDGYQAGDSGGANTVTPSGTIANATAGGTVANTTLAESQMPWHTHPVLPYPTFQDVASGGGNIKGGQTNRAIFATEGSGGSGAHTHGFTGTAHNHALTGTAQENRPPYYALAFIMKL